MGSRRMAQKRKYRERVQRKNLSSFQVIVKETDIAVQATRPLEDIARESVLKFRRQIEVYIRQHPDFALSLRPWPLDAPAPAVINDMARAGRLAGIGPMSAVAGAIAEFVGKDLLCHSEEVVIENGGDVFLKVDSPATVGIFAGHSPFSMRIGIRFTAIEEPFSVCTSSGTIGHSLSFGKADAVCAVSRSCTLADAAATAMGNMVKEKGDVAAAIDFGKQIEGIIGVVVIKDDNIGLWGDIKIVPLETAPPPVRER